MTAARLAYLINSVPRVKAALAFAEETFTPSKGAFALNRAVAPGALPVVEPVSKPRGQIIAYVRDLDGFLVELCTAMGA